MTAIVTPAPEAQVFVGHSRQNASTCRDGGTLLVSVGLDAQRIDMFQKNWTGETIAPWTFLRNAIGR